MGIPLEGQEICQVASGVWALKLIGIVIPLATRRIPLRLSMRRHGAKNADYRGGVTSLYDTQLLGACLHASESGGRYRPEAVRGMPEVPIAPQPRHGGCRLCQPSLFQQGVVGAFA